MFQQSINDGCHILYNSIGVVNDSSKWLSVCTSTSVNDVFLMHANNSTVITTFLLHPRLLLLVLLVLLLLVVHVRQPFHLTHRAILFVHATLRSLNPTPPGLI